MFSLWDDLYEEDLEVENATIYYCSDCNMAFRQREYLFHCKGGHKNTMDADKIVNEHNVDMAFITKDSGKREQFSTGMQRDTQDDKPRYDLIDRAFLKRWAELMARGAKKYGEDNWRKAATEEELRRFKASAIRHLMQYLEGDTREDHAAAVAFNLAGAEMVVEKLRVKGSLAF